MKILFWNSHGLESPHGIWTLFDLVEKEDPTIMFLQETRLQAKVMELKKFKLGFTSCLAVDCEGHSGGLSLLWSSEVSVSIFSFSKNHIHAIVCSQDCNPDYWFLTRIYGFLEMKNKRKT